MPLLPFRLTSLLAGLMLAQAALGLLFPGQYRDGEPIKTTWLGNDWVTLVVAVPLLYVGQWHARRGSVRGLLVWLGLLGYAAYNYAFYLLGAALNTLFLLYAAVVVLTATTLILALRSLRVAEVAAAFAPQTPVRLLGGCLVVIGTGLASVWTAIWAAYVVAGRPTPVAPEMFKLVAALDLSLMVPMLVSGGVLLWRRAAWGYVIAAIAGIQGALYLLVLSVGSIALVGRGVATASAELPIWAALMAVTAAVALRLLAHARRGSVAW